MLRLTLAQQEKLVPTDDQIDKLWKQCEEERMLVMQKARDEAEKWKAEGDMYGWNFHQGIASGTIAASFIYGRIFKSMKGNADDTD